MELNRVYTPFTKNKGEKTGIEKVVSIRPRPLDRYGVCLLIIIPNILEK